jgi:uncharacterized protein YndB with AHSA1/START domain
MTEFTVTRVLDASRERVWRALTQPDSFEQWLPAQPGSAALDVRTGGSWQATVVSGEGEEIALSGAYPEVSEPDRLVMTVPGGAVSDIRLTATSPTTTQITYAFDLDESMRDMVTESVDDVLSRVSKVLARVG